MLRGQQSQEQAGRRSIAAMATLGRDAIQTAVPSAQQIEGLPRTLVLEGFPGLRQMVVGGSPSVGAQGQAEATRPAQESLASHCACSVQRRPAGGRAGLTEPSDQARGLTPLSGPPAG